jgi:hypothetical protein
MADGRPTRWASRQIDRHANTILFIMLVVSLLAATWAAIGWNKARDAQERVTTIEVQRALEKKAADTNIVSMCFATARNRPQVIKVLTAFAAQLDDTIARGVILNMITEYDSTTPSHADCIRRARELGINPAPFDKDPVPTNNKEK